MSDYLECGHPRGCQGAIYDAEAAQPGTDDLPVRLGCKACERGGWVYVSEGLPPEGDDVIAALTGIQNDGNLLDICVCTPAGWHWLEHGGESVSVLGWRVYAWRYWPDPSPLPETEEGEG